MTKLILLDDEKASAEKATGNVHDKESLSERQQDEFSRETNSILKQSPVSCNNNQNSMGAKKFLYT